MSNDLHRVSHEVDDFMESGLYPGGTNLISDARYVLWDYNGTQPPDSNCALRLTCEPIDGSNENKPHFEYWNAGPSSEYVPVGDGEFIGNPTVGKKMSKSCNLYNFLLSLQNNCGLQKGKLTSTDAGIKALIGSHITFARMPPLHKRTGGFKDEQGGPRQEKEMLLATKATFAWEMKNKPAARPAPVASAAAPAAGMGMAAAPAPASSNGNSPLATALAEILAENSNAIETAKLGPMVTEKLSVVQGLGAAQRIKLMKELANPAKLAELAASQGWTLDTENGVLLVE